MTFLHTCFRPGFRHRFSSLLDGFWTPTWAYVGSFLAIFSVLSWSLILKSIFYRFCIDFWLPWYLKKWAGASTGIKFSSFHTSYLKLALGLHFDSPNPSKFEPKLLKNPSRHEIKILANFEVDFDRNLAPTWPPTWGPKKGPRVDFLELNKFLHWWKSGPDFHHAILGLKALWDRFLNDLLIDFWPVFDRFFIDLGPLF